MANYSAIAHQNLEICSPVPWPVYENIILGSKISTHPEILDIGCGKAGILAKVLDAIGGTGLGIDLPDSLASAITPRAEGLRTLGKLQILLEDANAFLQSTHRRFDLIICIGSSHALGGPAHVFESTERLLKPKGKILFGEIVWKSQPSKEFLEFLDCSEAEQMYSTQLFELAEKCGLSILQSASCSDSDFDAYENELKNTVNAWIAGNAHNPVAGQFAKRSEVWGEAREKWARSAFGFEVFTAIRS